MGGQQSAPTRQFRAEVEVFTIELTDGQIRLSNIVSLRNEISVTDNTGRDSFDALVDSEIRNIVERLEVALSHQQQADNSLGRLT